MKHYEVVCALIYNDKGEVFIAQRGPRRALCGLWEFPGGKVEQNETHEETIVREIKEELNGTIKPIKYIGKSYYEYTNLIDYEPFSITLYAYKCELISGFLTISEHTNGIFVNKEDLKNYEFANADIPFLKFI